MTAPETADQLWKRIHSRLDEMSGQHEDKLQPERLAARLAARAQALKAQTGRVEPVGPQLSILAVRHGPQRYGIPVDDVSEILSLEDYSPVPTAPDFIAGVVSWRGLIIALIDLLKLFGITATGLTDEKCCVIVEARGTRVGLLVSEVEDLCTLSVDEIAPSPELHGDAPVEVVTGVHDTNRLILSVGALIDDPRLVAWK